VIRIDFDANVHHLHLLIYLAVQTLPTWCFCPFLLILNVLRLQVLTEKESNLPFTINAAKSEMLQGKCLQFWLLINGANLCFGLKSIQTALPTWAFDFFGYYKVSEYIKLNEFEPCYQL
jgi:hypothetical protein